MKKTFLMTILILTSVIAFNINLTAKDGKKLPSVKVKTTKGEIINASDFNNGGKPFIISFWATWCKPCLQELTTIHEVYPEWVKQTGVKLYAVSIDDSRNSKKVAPLSAGRGWKFDVILDENSDLKRALGVNNPPHTFLVNGKGEIVWEHNGYAPGDEKELLIQIKKLIK